MVDEKTIEKAGRLLLDAVPPGSGVYLFGSHAGGGAGPGSDLDFLIVEPELEDQMQKWSACAMFSDRCACLRISL